MQYRKIIHIHKHKIKQNSKNTDHNTNRIKFISENTEKPCPLA